MYAPMRRGLNQPPVVRVCAPQQLSGGPPLGRWLPKLFAGGVLQEFDECFFQIHRMPHCDDVLRRIDNQTLPAFMSEMRSQRMASFMKWVETKIVTSSLRERSTRICQNLSRATGSTPEVGSSSSSISGEWIIATAS